VAFPVTEHPTAVGVFVCLSSASSLEKEGENKQLETESYNYEQRRMDFFFIVFAVASVSQGSSLGKPRQISVGEDKKGLGKGPG